jgi:imidazole glycerol phosphate synthase glutamine amidotransferase subunit
MKKNISLIDFGAGNLHSVYKAFKFIGADVEITKDIGVIEKSDAVIFPGVGAFGAVMSSIKKNNLQDIIIKSAKSSKPFLGICVGMQVLFEDSEENPEEKGLGIFKGKVVRFKKAKTVPHIGWNSVIARSEVTKQSHNPENGDEIASSGLRLSRNDMNRFYFVHSYYVAPEDKNIIFAETEYDTEKFTSIIKKDNLLAVQFHPEKSGNAGLELLKEFVLK